ncbi:MAG: group 1 glycosyl transferase [Acidobacteria bacterium]|nr:MAG: group 1 glycosyl transferase [Acidobacteriota bacterium]
MPISKDSVRIGALTEGRSKVSRRFTIISSCSDLWGGSEELWSAAACALAENGHSVSCFKTGVDTNHPSVRRLKSFNCTVRNLRRRNRGPVLIKYAHVLPLALHLLTRRPDLVLISQGDNYDGLYLGYLCQKLGIPYTLICQKASDYLWPEDKLRSYKSAVFEGAVKCFFVSEHNRRLTEDQYGITLKNAQVVRNPYMVRTAQPLPWPVNDDDNLKLACVARLYLLDKGQDMLLRVLARNKWKERKLHVSFFGQGVNRQSLESLAGKLGIQNISFEGQTSEVISIWRDHHALILPSRAEGMPLSLVESMMCGRPGIVTNVGGTAEIVEDRVTGFLAAPVEDSLDAVLEEMWARRHDLREMGRRAATRIRELVSPNPAQDFANMLLKIVGELAEAKTRRHVVGHITASDPSPVRVSPDAEI